MKETPIIFSTPMIQAILTNDKDRTRRVIKPQPKGEPYLEIARSNPQAAYYDRFISLSKRGAMIWSGTCPYGSTGEKLWVRETIVLNRNPKNPRSIHPVYKADGTNVKMGLIFYKFPKGKICPSIFMPRWASRITLEITNVRVERLQEITEQEAGREGIVEIQRSLTRDGRMNGYGTIGTSAEDASTTRLNAFIKAWEKINGKTGEKCWKANPFLWVLEFKRVK